MKTIQMTLTALALIAVPTLGSAMCMGESYDTVASCADGMTFDTKTRTCVPQTTS